MAPDLVSRPLLPPLALNPVVQQAIGNTFKSTTNIAKLLPTGTVLAFQLLSPTFTNHGHCDSSSRPFAVALMAVCSVFCIFHSFTDSFKDDEGIVRYCIATPGGLWVVDGGEPPLAEITVTYRLRFIDFLHAFMSLLVFAAVALFDQNEVTCFCPIPSEHTKEMIGVLPMAIGVFCSMLFVAFPTNRHGIGFPVAPHT